MNGTNDPLANLANLDAQYEAATPASPGDAAFEVIPEDTHVTVVAVDQKPAFVGAKQTPVCKVTFEVVAPEQYIGRRVWHDFWLTEANVKYLKRDLTLLGWRGRPTQLLQQEDASLVNLGAEVVVGIEEFPARDRNTGEPVLNQDGTPKMRQKNVIKFFSAPYSPTAPAKAAPTPAPAQPPKAAPKAAPPPVENDDTIPF